MITELEIVEAKIEPGRKIRAVAYSTNNHNLHKLMKPASHMLFWMLEADTNNASRTIVPSDVKEVWRGVEYIEKELEVCIKFGNQPTGNRELTYKIVFPEAVEMVRFANQKWERAAQQIMHMCRVCMGLDSGRTQGFVDMADVKLIQETMKVTKEILKTFIGTGEVNTDGDYDTGLPAPAFSALGIIQPDNDLDVAVIGEPSPDRPEAMLPDAPDTPAPNRPTQERG